MYRRLLYRVTNTNKKAAEKEDWQYCAAITSALNQNKLQLAMRVLMQSYFHRVTLDRQIYNNIALKFIAANMPTSYPQVIYRLYRTSFKPSRLMLPWMWKLIETEDQSFLTLLKADYEALNTPYPQSPPKAEPASEVEPYKEANSQLLFNEEERFTFQSFTKITIEGKFCTIEAKNNKCVIEDVNLSKIVSLLDPEMKLQAHKIVLYDLELVSSVEYLDEVEKELEASKNEADLNQDEEEEEEEEEEEDQEWGVDDFIAMLEHTKLIKIGKVEFITKKPDQ